MIHKTFNEKQDAEKWLEDMESQGGVAVIGKLGEKFRVYVRTKESIEQSHAFNKAYTPVDARRYLRAVAWNTRQAIDDALKLQRMMADNSLYNDYESMIEAARIMESVRELKCAKDVFTFFDNPSKYDEPMKRFIEETLEEYDYEAKEEVAKD